MTIREQLASIRNYKRLVDLKLSELALLQQELGALKSVESGLVRTDVYVNPYQANLEKQALLAQEALKIIQEQQAPTRENVKQKMQQAELNALEQACLMEYYFGNIKQRDIADHFCIGEKSVSVILTRAKNKLDAIDDEAKEIKNRI